MRDKKIQLQTLDEMLKEMDRKMAEYSFTLGDWGKFVSIIIYVKDKEYNAGSVSVNLPEIKGYGGQYTIKYIYTSSYYYPTDSYYIEFNHNIRKSMNGLEVENIRNIEKLAIDILHNLDPYPSKNYNKISIYFKRDVQNYKIISGEIERSIINRQYIYNMFKFPDPLVFMFTTSYYKFIFKVDRRKKYK